MSPCPSANRKRSPRKQAALLAAIVAQPDEDTARLVYADWLQEHDDEPQAQFIRGWIKFAKMKGETPKRHKMGKDLRKLEMEHGRQWLQPLGLEGASPNFKRGIAESVAYTDIEAYFCEEEALFRLLPVRSLCFGTRAGTGFTNEQLHQLAQRPKLALVRSLELQEHTACDTKYWRELFHSSHLANLTYLRVVECKLGDAEAEAIASSPSFANLTTLDLEKNRVRLAGCRALVTSPHLTNLANVQLSDNDFGSNEVCDEAWAMLATRFDGSTYCRHEPS